MLAGSLFDTKRTGDPAIPWRKDNAPPTLLFPAALAGAHPRPIADGFLTPMTSPPGSGATSIDSPRDPISVAKDGKSKMMFARGAPARTGFALHKSGEARHCARR